MTGRLRKGLSSLGDAGFSLFLRQAPPDVPPRRSELLIGEAEPERRLQGRRAASPHRAAGESR